MPLHITIENPVPENLPAVLPPGSRSAPDGLDLAGWRLDSTGHYGKDGFATHYTPHGVNWLTVQLCDHPLGRETDQDGAERCVVCCAILRRAPQDRYKQISREAYKKLIDDDLAYLIKACPLALERAHILKVLENSVEFDYPTDERDAFVTSGHVTERLTRIVSASSGQDRLLRIAELSFALGMRLGDQSSIGGLLQEQLAERNEELKNALRDLAAAKEYIAALDQQRLEAFDPIKSPPLVLPVGARARDGTSLRGYTRDPGSNFYRHPVGNTDSGGVAAEGGVGIDSVDWTSVFEWLPAGQFPLPSAKADPEFIGLFHKLWGNAAEGRYDKSLWKQMQPAAEGRKSYAPEPPPAAVASWNNLIGACEALRDKGIDPATVHVTILGEPEAKPE